MKNIEKIMNIAKHMNSLENFKLIRVPVLDNFILVQRNLTDESHKIIFIAIKNNTIEQFLTDGALNEKESFNDRLEATIDEINNSVKENPLYNGNNEYLIYYKNYDSEYFDFKIYAQDVLTGTPDKIKFVRQLSAFFLEPKTNEFYQISMAAGQYAKSDKYKLLKDIPNIENDEIIKGLERNLQIVMDNITYRD